MAQLLNYYIVVIQLVIQSLASHLYREEARSLYNTYLFIQTGIKIGSEDFSDILQNYTEWYFGIPLRLQGWRHIAVAIKREFIPPSYADLGLDEIGDQQQGYNTATARWIYGTISGSLPFLTTDTLLGFEDHNQQWFNVIGLRQGATPLPLKTLSKYISQATQHLSNIIPTSTTLYDNINSNSQRDIIKAIMDKKLVDFMLSLEASFRDILSSSIASLITSSQKLI